MNYLDKYKLNKKGFYNLYKCGFRNGTYKKSIYKDMIQFIIKIDEENNTWEYQVLDLTSNSLYTGFYNREYGRNQLVKELDNQINKIFRELIRKNIFEKRGN